jgi:hypothetical protein
MIAVRLSPASTMAHHNIWLIQASAAHPFSRAYDFEAYMLFSLANL